MKQRFSSLDIKIIAHELSSRLTSLRVSNIYDLSSRIFLFKFAKPEHREQLLVDSGFRCHLTAFGRTTAGTPSPFVARLRKFLKTRRVTAVAQLGTDRILEIQFSDGQYRLFLEFYAGGNIVLTDKELNILALLRNVNDGAAHEQIRQGSDYNTSERQNVFGVPDANIERVRSGLQKWVDKQASLGEQLTTKKRTGKLGDALRKALSSCINEYPPILLDHAMRVTGVDATQSPQDVLQDELQLEKVVAALEEAHRVVDGIIASEPIKGYIFGKFSLDKTHRSTTGSNEDTTDNQSDGIKTNLYNDFHPFKPLQFSGDELTSVLEVDGFNQTVDEFFSSIEGQKLESRLLEREAAARKKLENARHIQEERIGGLQAVQEVNVRKAQAIEANLERVEEAVAAINGLIAQGIDWIEIDQLIELEQARGNRVAEIIRLPLKLHENTATILLDEWNPDADGEVGADEGDGTDSEPSESEGEDTELARTQELNPKEREPRLQVDIDLALSAWANAREYYEQKKHAASKEEKTLQASARALKSATQKIEADLKKSLKQEKAVLRPVRKHLWFEKFIYFISSDGYLVIGGKDAQQTDLIYKRYLKKGDVYVHADLNGASSVIVKNNMVGAPIPPSTLAQAGNLSVATSAAWDSKAVMSAWWVPAENVTKTALSSDFVRPGVFHVTGDKNFLPPAQLLLGFAVIFQISENSKARHVKHRIKTVATAESDELLAKQQPTLDSHDLQVDVTSIANSDAENDSSIEDHHEVDVCQEEDSDNRVDNAERNTEDETENEDESENENQNQNQNQNEDEDDSEAVNIDNPLQPRNRTHQRQNGSNLGNVVQYDHISSALSNNTSGMSSLGSGKYSVDASREGNEDDGMNRIEKHIPYTPTDDKERTSKTSLPVRGKRGKKKKIAQRYADQDEDDRAEAMRLLGSTAGRERAEEEARAKTAKLEEAEKLRIKRKEQQQRAQEEWQRREQQRRLEEDDAAHDDEDDDETNHVDLGTLVGTPLHGDEILDAIPVCAPWSSLQTYKYKVKLQPGSQKKGKAIREILGAWTAAGANRRNVDVHSEDKERIWPREMELINLWKDTEIFNVLPVSKVRVMMSGSGGGQSSKGKGRSGRGPKKGR